MLRACFLLLFFCSAISFAEEEKSYKMAVTGLSGLEELERNFGPFQQALNQVTGLKIKFYPLSSRTVVIQALKGKAVDFVLFGPAEYVVAASQVKIHPIAALSRADYFSAIVVLADSPIKTLRHLKGKVLGTGDFGSTSYHLGPLQLVSDVGINIRDDLKVIPSAKQVSWHALKSGDIDALGIKYEQYLKFRDEEKELDATDFRVIARGADLPHDVFIAGGHIPLNIVEKIKLLIKHNSDTLIAAILQGLNNDKYGSMKFVSEVDDSDYDYVRNMFATIGYPEFLGKVR